MRDLDAELRASGELLQSEGLSGPARAVVVRAGDSGPVVYFSRARSEVGWTCTDSGRAIARLLNR